MNTNIRYVKYLRYTITLVVILFALFFGLWLWHNYMDGSWTRDGRVRAEIVMVAPDVGGLVADVRVRDNQYVEKGELLFEIDKKRFVQNLANARDLADARKTDLELKRNQYERRVALNSATLSEEEKNNAKLALKTAKAVYESALTQVAVAKLDLERCSVRAPFDGWVTNLQLRRGEFLARGESRLSLIEKDSYWVYGYFEEHKLPYIHADDPVEMKVLGTSFVLKGHVRDIARGITDRDNSDGQKNLADVNPVFTWIRLAQRIPVHINIDSVPKGCRLVAGMTCSVVVMHEK